MLRRLTAETWGGQQPPPLMRRPFTEGSHMTRVFFSIGMIAAGLMPLAATLFLLTQN